jgi:hypothetical protein
MHLRSLALVPLLLLVLAPSLDAQYFGQNQVRWDRFDFQVMETEHFLIHYYPEAEDAIVDASRMAERWYERLARAFSFELREKNPLILYADHPDFQQTNVIEGRIGEGTGGVTEGLRNRVIMPLTESNADTDHVLGHELVHAFQFELATRSGGPGLRAMMAQPLWLIEGLAEYLSVGRADAHTAMWLRDAILRDDFPTLRALSQRPRDYFPYRYGHAFWAYVAGRWDDDTAMSLFRNTLDRGFSGAVSAVLESTPDSLGAQWEATVRADLQPQMEGRLAPQEVGVPLLTRESTGGRLNVAPSLSPDGSRIAFLSERGVFSIELFLADAQTGEVIRRLVSTETDPHFDALAFIQSAGAWSPNGDRFAFVVFARGENRLVVVDSDSGRRLHEFGVEGVGAMTHPAWSPDGRYLAFAGQSAGRSDLWLLEVETGEARRLTQDGYSALQPAWSPDGSTLAFVTDRGPDTDLNRLHFGPLRLAFYQVESGEVEELSPFPVGKAINPAFSPDGRSLYFIADPDGFSDVYRMELESGNIYRVTRIATGISGISSRSPALTVAARDGRLAFSVFSAGEYSVHALASQEAEGDPVSPAQLASELPGALPPVDRSRDGFVMAFLGDPNLGLPPRLEPERRRYRGGLGLEYIGPVAIGIGADQFGTGLAGSITMVFSDMLRDQQVQLTVDAQGDVQDIGGQAVYLNRAGRWLWGGAVGRIPFRTGFTTIGPGDAPGETVVRQRIQRTSLHQATGLARYPFSRIRRAEFSAGVSRYDFDMEIWEWRLVGGRVVESSRESAPSDMLPDAINLVRTSAALVEDNSVMGFVGPIRGQRWRLEVQPTFGSLDYVTGLADFRRYFWGRPVTIATRALHLGRYGSDEEDPRLSPYFLGYESLVRGYGLGSFEPGECTQREGAGQQGCPEWDRLFGSRMGVANLEVRVPLLGVEGHGIFSPGLFPMDVGAFVDAGVAWTSSESPELTWETRSIERIPVVSAGLTTRIGLGQFLALEIFYAHPFQRPEKGGHFGFQLAPAW